MGDVKETLELWKDQEQLRLRASLRRLPAVARTGTKRIVHRHPVATGAAAAALAASAALVGFWVVRRARRPGRPQVMSVVRRAKPSPFARVGKVALKAIPSLLLAVAGVATKDSAPPLTNVPRARRSPWSGAPHADGQRAASDRDHGGAPTARAAAARGPLVDAWTDGGSPVDQRPRTARGTVPGGPANPRSAPWVEGAQPGAI